MRKSVVRRLIVLAMASALFAPLLSAGDAPSLFYSRSFPGSKPDYIQIVVEKSGDAVYQEAVDDDLPLKFKLNAEDTAAIYDLVGETGSFQASLGIEPEGCLYGREDVPLRRRRQEDRG